MFRKVTEYNTRLTGYSTLMFGHFRPVHGSWFVFVVLLLKGRTDEKIAVTFVGLQKIISCCCYGKQISSLMCNVGYYHFNRMKDHEFVQTINIYILHLEAPPLDRIKKSFFKCDNAFIKKHFFMAAMSLAFKGSAQLDPAWLCSRTQSIKLNISMFFFWHFNTFWTFFMRIFLFYATKILLCGVLWSSVSLKLRWPFYTYIKGNTCIIIRHSLRFKGGNN